MGRPDFYSFPPTGRFPLARATGLPCLTPGIGHPASTRRAPPGGKSRAKGVLLFYWKKFPKIIRNFFQFFIYVFTQYFFKIFRGPVQSPAGTLSPGYFLSYFSRYFLDYFLGYFLYYFLSYFSRYFLYYFLGYFSSYFLGYFPEK